MRKSISRLLLPFPPNGKEPNIPHLFPDLEKLQGYRDGDLQALEAWHALQEEAAPAK